MTEAEWLACKDPSPMLEFVHRKVSERKLRLFSCGCCRRIWSLLTDNRSRSAVELAERLSDEPLDAHQLQNAEKEAREAHQECDMAASAASDTLSNPDQAAFDGSIAAACAVRLPVWRGRDYACEVKEFAAMSPEDRNAVLWSPEPKAARLVELESQAFLLRDIFGNPFRPVIFSPEWRTSTALSLAKQMYDSRDFSAMPILADALQDAGCDNDDILNHCRDANQVHVRGCWVVDLVLGKE